MTARRTALLLAAAPWTWLVVRGVHPWLDAVALLLPVLLVSAIAGVLVWSVAVREVAGAVATVSWVAAFVVFVVLPWAPLGAGEVRQPMRIVEANVLGGADRVDALVDALLARRPDLLVLPEASPELQAALRPHFAHSSFRYDVAVFSRYDLGDALRAPGDQRGMQLVVRGPSGAFHLYAEHVQKPGFRTSLVESGFRTHRRTVEAIADAADDDWLPALLVGDLNLVDRSSGYRRLTRSFDDAMRAGWTGPTSVRLLTRPLLARIDHIFVPEGWCSRSSRLFEVPGSDHRGTEAVVGPCR